MPRVRSALAFCILMHGYSSGRIASIEVDLFCIPRDRLFSFRPVSEGTERAVGELAGSH
jgi:hypothetical protein